LGGGGEKKYLKAKIKELENNSKVKIIKDRRVKGREKIIFKS
jgi:hypothetical protein